MADHDFLSCSLMVTTSNEFNFNLSMEYAPNWGHWVSTSNSFQWINPLLNWNYLFARIGFSTPKRKPSWINLHHFYSNFIFIFFNFLIMNKSSFFTQKKKKRRRRRKFSKKALGLRALGSYFLGCFQKKSSIKIFNSFKKIQDFQIFFKKKNPKFSILLKNSSFPNSKKKKKSSLNSSTGTESYDLH